MRDHFSSITFMGEDIGVNLFKWQITKLKRF